MKKRIVIVASAILLGLVATHTSFYGPPGQAPSGVAIEMLGQCTGYTWSNGVGQTGFWAGCDQ